MLQKTKNWGLELSIKITGLLEFGKKDILRKCGQHQGFGKFNKGDCI